MDKRRSSPRSSVKIVRRGRFICDWTTAATGWSVIALMPVCFIADLEYPIAQLERGDQVSMQLRQDSRGNSSTDLIRVQESIRDRNQSRGILFGRNRNSNDRWRVERVDFQRSSSKSAISPERPSSFLFPTMLGGRMVDHFRALRSGDYVRVEGRFIS